MGDEQELIEDILEQVLNTWPEQLEKLHTTILSKSDIKRIQQQAHSLKGAAANIGAEDFMNIACEIESSNNLEKSEILHQKLEKLFFVLRDSINRTREGIDN
ncbi:MAG: Hpt domain-containing protein [Deltaproteobacteria bacterium]|nr:Hpt domain-containing protein [Deltaproteobacteria bacterium]